MLQEEAKESSRQQKAVLDDKFDRHMKNARKNDKISRQKVFVEQTEANLKRSKRIRSIKSSIY